MHSSLADSEFSASRLNVLFNIADAHLSTLRGPPPRPSLALDVQAPDKDDSELLSEIYDNPWVGSVSHSLASIKSCSGGDGSDNYDTGSEQQGQQSSTSSRREEANEEQEREGGAEPGTEEQRKKERATTSPLPVQSSPNSEYTILRGKNGTLIPIRGPLSPFTLAIWEKAMISPKDSDTAAVEHPSRSSSDHTIKSPMSGATAIFESPPSRDPNQRLPGSLSPCMSSTPDVFGGNTLISSRSRGDADGAAKPKSSCTYQQLSASGTSRRIRPRKSVKDLDLVFSMDDFLTKLPSIPQSPLRL
ncbi:hypothetical protein EV182_007035 [Spiromyces aspiralis]|uniref:Uncharacterized protein n=1 Tax=Spiromyces aspiralis TaxID=68401 RepID=A0ACC1HKJ1_9FUNG|nr:hypothetical protein EV182_007035 [Spiromyces aspiralis]